MTEQVAPIAKNQSAPFLMMNISGRIELSRFVNGSGYYTQLKTPAPDQFSQPSTFEVHSKEQLGEVGSMVTGKVQLSGFVKPRKYQDTATGQQKTFYDKTVYMEWVI